MMYNVSAVEPDIGLDAINQPVIIFVCVIYSLVIITGSVLNPVIILTIARTKSLRTAMNGHLANQAISDLVVCAIVIPCRLVLYTTAHAHNSRDMRCKMDVFLKTTCDSVQFAMLGGMSYERYKSVSKPFDKEHNVRRTFFTVVLSWVFAICVGSVTSMQFGDSVTIYPCYREFGNNGTVPFIQFSEAFITLPLCIICLSFILVFYHFMIRFLKQHNTKMKLKRNKVAPITDPPPRRTSAIKDESPQVAGITEASPDVTTTATKVTLLNSDDTNPRLPWQTSEINESHLDINSLAGRTVSHQRSDLGQVESPSRSKVISTDPAAQARALSKDIQSDTAYMNAEKNGALLRFENVARVHILTRKHLLRTKSTSNLSSNACKSENTRSLRRFVENDLIGLSNTPDLKVKTTDEKVPITTINETDLKDKYIHQTLRTTLSDGAMAQPPRQFQKPKTDWLPKETAIAQYTSDRHHSPNEHAVARPNDIHGENAITGNVHSYRTNAIPNVIKCNDTNDSSNTAVSINSSQTNLQLYLDGNNSRLNSLVETLHKRRISSDEGVLPLQIPNNICIESHHKTERALIACHTSSNCPQVDTGISTNMTSHEVNTEDKVMHSNSTTQNYTPTCGKSTKNEHKHVVFTTPTYKNSAVKERMHYSPTRQQPTSTYDNNTVDKLKRLDPTAGLSTDTTKSTVPTTQECVVQTDYNAVECNGNLNQETKVLYAECKDNEEPKGTRSMANDATPDQTKETGTSSQTFHELVSKVDVVEMDGTVHKDVVVDGAVVGAVCVMNKSNRLQGRRKVEMRAAKRIAILIGSFVILWLPLPVAALVLSSEEQTSVSDIEALLVTGSISALTGSFNPIFNLLLNKQLRSASIRMLKNGIRACKRVA